MHCTAFIQLTEAGGNIPAEVPGPRQRATYLLDSLKTLDPKILAGMAAIKQDIANKQTNSNNSVTFLLPSCPVVAKNVKAKGLGANVSGTTEGVPGGVRHTVGKTAGVKLCWHDPSKFAKLPKEQKVELAAWNKENR